MRGLILAGTAGVAIVALAAIYAAPGKSLAVVKPSPAVSVADSSDGRIHLSAAQRKEAVSSGLWADEPRSLLRVDRRMKYGDFLWDEEGVPPGPLSIRVDLQTQLLSVFRAGHEIGTAVVLYGADEKETPLGTFPILWKRKDHRSSLYDAPMPYTLRLTEDGIAIHGSNVRWGAATHGCIGVPTEFAAHLFEDAQLGDEVLIVRSDAVHKIPLRESALDVREVG